MLLTIAVTTVGIYILVDLVGLNEIISPFLASLTAIPFTYIIIEKNISYENPKE